MPLPDKDHLIACPQCDLLHAVPDVAEGHRAACARCGTVLISPRAGAFVRVVGLALTAAILMVAAIFFPFLEINAQGFRNATSVFDAVLAFTQGWMLPLAVAVAALIVLIPIMRFFAVIYTLAPLIAGQRALPGAKTMFRLSETLRPWSMAEIFIIGVAVALVKVAGLAQVSLGPAFWAFIGLVIATALQDTLMCRHTVWTELERR